MALVEELQEASGRVVSQAGPAVVRIGRGWGRGAGIVVADGVVVTNAHNLRGQETTVTFSDGRVSTGAVTGVDVEGDLAVLTVGTSGITPVSWDPAAVDVKVGTPVWALSSIPGGGVRVTVGTVSAVGQQFRGPRGRHIAGSVEHTAPLVRGSSGGPIVDSQGRLIGLNTHRLDGGFYLAVPAGAELKGRIDALARGESPRRLRLGIAVAPPFAARKLRAAVGLPERDGILIRGVEEESPAARAGLRTGDLIVAAGSTTVTSVDDLHQALDAVGEGDTLALRIVRGSEELDVSVGFGPTSTGAEGSA
jgi:serine protease Do